MTLIEEYWMNTVETNLKKGGRYSCSNIGCNRCCVQKKCYESQASRHNHVDFIKEQYTIRKNLEFIKTL